MIKIINCDMIDRFKEQVALRSCNSERYTIVGWVSRAQGFSKAFPDVKNGIMICFEI